MNTPNQDTAMKKFRIVLGLMLTACSGEYEAGESGEYEAGEYEATESVEYATLEQQLRTLESAPQAGSGKRHMLGVMEPASTNGRQGPAAVSFGIVSVPKGRDFSLRFTGFGGGTTESQVKSAFTAVENSFAMTYAYGYSHLANNANNAYIKVSPTTISGGVFKVGTTSADNILSFVNYQCTLSSSNLTESFTGIYKQHANGSDVCTINLDITKLNTYCNGGATCFDRVLKHAAGLSLAYVGGIGRAQTNVLNSGAYTALDVNTAAAKTNSVSGQGCLGFFWDTNNAGQYTLATFGTCAALPEGW